MADDTNVFDQLIGQIEDESLRHRLEREVELLRGSRRFGLVFDRHLPESVRLSGHPIRKGVRVALRDESSQATWKVLGFVDRTRSVAVLDGDGGEQEVQELVVVREFGEPIYPGLISTERIANGPFDSPWDAVINGENFHALQALRSTHRGKVDLIYIDPPYNTGNDGWIYNDRYVDQRDRAKSSKWLSFIERRLLIARDLLKPTGVFIAAVGDEEHHRLRMLLDQVFGAGNFLANITWQGSGKNDARYTAGGVDYMLAYARDEEALNAAGCRWREPKPGLELAHEAARASWADAEGDPDLATAKYRAALRRLRDKLEPAVFRYDQIDSDGRAFQADNLTSPKPRQNLRYEVTHPVTKLAVPTPTNGWRYSREAMSTLIDEKRIVFGPDEATTPRLKRFLADQETRVPYPSFTESTMPGSKRVETILGDRRFPNPKDVEVLMRWIGAVAPPDAVVLDFFGGSGTTTDAVIRLNDRDGGTRQSLLVTNNEIGASEAKRLRANGFHPGDAEWESHGVFEYVCHPRISTVVSGTRPDGSVYSDGLPANVEMFHLSYLDPGMVRRGGEFAAIAPLMWLEAGAVGPRISEVPEEDWALTESYGVLFSIDALVPFTLAVAQAATSNTPTSSRVRDHRLPDGVPVCRRAFAGRNRVRSVIRGLSLQLHHQHRERRPVKFTLEEYQTRAVEAVLANLAKARKEYSADGERNAVGLTAPTGAGKTVIATAVLEGLFLGTSSRPPHPRLTILWLTDDRSLNAQTIGKILQASGGRIDANRVRFLGDTDERTLEPGYIYFVHIQALQKNSTLHAVRADGSRNDRRTFGAWDMIANTVRDRGEDFVVIWDEAHRGSGTTKTDRKSIARTIVNGGLTNVGSMQPAAPVVLGISATPDRFYSAMSAAGRTIRLVEVPPSDVRESGLLKDRILLRNIAEAQSAASTMLSLAVEDLKASDAAWRGHHEITGNRLVEPLLVVQVEQKITEARLVEILSVITTTWPELTDYAIAHAFGDPHGPLRVGDREVRYLPPEAISGDDRARVVLFKSALTTGWDCPRAEVLVSFQGKDSYTEIAQLIGRLVRTPLAKRVEGGDDRLNEVVAYLPGFRTEHVFRVVSALTEDETVQVEVMVAPEICGRSASVPGAVFDLLDTLPSYMRPKTSFPTRTAQLMRLAAALNEHGLVVKASMKARAWIVDQMRAGDGQREDEIDSKVRDILALTVDTTVVNYGAAIMLSVGQEEAETSERDLDAYYNRATRRLPDGSAAWYFTNLCDRGYDEVDAAVRVAALSYLDFKELIEDQAAALISAWREQHRSAVSRMPRPVRNLIEPLWHIGTSPMHPTTVELRDTYPASTEKLSGAVSVPIATYSDHLYVLPDGRSSAGEFPVDTSRSSWERAVLEAELAAVTLVGWYRNPSSGRHALAVPYVFGDKHQLMHPDFLFWHDDGDGQFVMDIVDPHRHDIADTAAKWSALSRYAQDHSDRVRRCLAVLKIGDQLRALDLTAEEIEAKVADATNKNLIEDLFERDGMNYP